MNNFETIGLRRPIHTLRMWMQLVCLAIFVLSGCLRSRVLNEPIFHLGQNLPPLESLNAVNSRNAENSRRTAGDVRHVGVVVLDERRLTLSLYPPTGQQAARLDVHQVVLVQDEAGVYLGNLSIPYGQGETILNVDAVTVRPDGRRIPVPSQSIFDSTVYRSGGDAPWTRAVKNVLFPDVEPGVLLEVVYTVRYDHWPPGDSLNLDEGLPVHRAVFEIESPEFASFQVQTRGFASMGKNNVGHDGYFAKIRERWLLENFVPADEESFAPNPSKKSPFVAYTMKRWSIGGKNLNFVSNWRLAGGRFYDSIKPTLSQSVPGELIRGLENEDDRSKVAILFQRVQAALADRMSLERNEKPPTLEQVFARRYATFDEQALLLLKALHAVNIQARLAVVADENSEDFAPEAPTFALHRGELMVLVRDELGHVYLDPSCRGCAAGTLRPDHQKRRVVVIEPLSPEQKVTMGTEDVVGEVTDVRVEFAMTPAQGETDGLIIRRFDVRASPRGLLVDGTHECRGPCAADIRSYFRDNPTSLLTDGRAARRRYLDDLADGRIGIAGLDDPHAPITFQLESVLLARGGYVDSDALLMISVSALAGAAVLDAFEEKRGEAVNFRALPGFEHEFRIESPGRLVQAPKSASITSPFAEYVFQVEPIQDTLVLKERLKFREGDIPLKRYPEFFDFIRKVRALRDDVIAWKKPN